MSAGTRTVVSVHDVPLARRVDAWRTAVSRTFVPIEVDAGDATHFDGSLRSEKIGALQVTLVRATPHRAIRTEALCSDSGPLLIKIGMPLTGCASITQGGRTAVVHPGDLVLYDTSRPYEIRDETGGFLVVVVEANRLGLPQSALQQLSCRPLLGDDGIGVFFSPMLRALAEHLDQVPQFQSERLGEHVLEGIRTMYAELLRRDGYRPEDAAAVILARVHDVIEERLRNPWLCPDAIAAECFISTGYLHKLFRTEGTTVSAFIRTRRLEKCRRALLDPANWDRPVGTIGAEWGFLDAAHFSRVFKAEFGVGPRDYRALAAAPDVARAG